MKSWLMFPTERDGAGGGGGGGGGWGGGEVTPAFQQSDNKQLLGEKMNLL